MNDPHLLPNQIDLLVDGDAGFTARPMRAHLAECADCRRRFEAAQRAADAVEALPHFTPRLPFADQVMSKVQVIEPWHVAVEESARAFVPPRGPMRVLAIVGGGMTALLITGGVLWLSLRWDLASWLLNVGFERGRALAAASATSLATGALGADVSATLASGSPWTLLLMAGLGFVALLAAGLGFRRLAAAARAKRS